MFRPSRARSSGNDRHLAWKIRLFALGAALALAGIAIGNSWVVWGGVSVLAGGALLRFLGCRD